MNISNYARSLELSKYNKINESAILEADANPTKALEQIKSGKTGGAYADQWKQVQDAVVAGHEADQTAGKVMVKHTNGTDMVTVNWKITNGKVDLSVDAASGAATGNASNINTEVFIGYDPKGKFNEFIAALITISIEKFGKSWTKAHIDWVNLQISRLSQLDSIKAIKGDQSGSGSFVNSPILKGDGDVFTPWINPLYGGDRPTQIDAIGRVNKIAGSATTDAQVNMILQTINVKLQESIIQFTDERAIHGLYMLISPKYTASQIVTMYQAITGGQDGLLTTIKARGASDDATTTYKGPFVQWLVGTRGSQNNSDIVKSYKNFDMASYSASLAKLKECLK